MVQVSLELPRMQSVRRGDWPWSLWGLRAAVYRFLWAINRFVFSGPKRSEERETTVVVCCRLSIVRRGCRNLSVCITWSGRYAIHLCRNDGRRMGRHASTDLSIGLAYATRRSGRLDSDDGRVSDFEHSHELVNSGCETGSCWAERLSARRLGSQGRVPPIVQLKDKTSVC